MAFAAYSSVITIYLRNFGLTFGQIGVLWSFILLSTTISDFPTGNLADKYGRVKIYSIGLLILGVGKLFFAYGSSFVFFLGGALLIGVGQAQMSGALSSWLVDKLGIMNYSKDATPRFFGNAQIIGSVAGAVMGLALGSALQGSLKIGILISAFLNIFNAIILPILVVDNYGSKKSTWASISISSIKHFMRSWVLIILTMLSFVFYSIYSIYLFLWQPMAVQIGIPSTQLGYFYSTYIICTGLGGVLWGRVAKSHKSRSGCLLVSCFLTGIGLGLMGIGQILSFYILGLVLFGFGYGGFFPIYMGWSQAYIPSEIRASVTSLSSTVSSGGLVLSQIALGALIDRFGLIGGASFSSVGLTVLAIFLILILALKKNEGQVGKPCEK